MRRLVLALAAFSTVACGMVACGSTPEGPQDAGGGGVTSQDAGGDDGAMVDAASDSTATADAADASQQQDAAGDASGDASGDANGDASGGDASGGDASSADGAVLDAGSDSAGSGDAAGDSSGGGVITGGPCLSGAAGATAFRIRWVDAGGTAQVDYEVDGLPTQSPDSAGAYGYQIPFTPQFVDPYLAEGGLQLDASDFVDLQMSTVGLSSITSATLSIYGRSYSVDTNGSYNWQTFDGTGQTPTDFVSNVAPYQWYSADMTTEIGPGESNVLVRVKAGPSSDALVVNRIELCVVAQ